MKKQLLLLYLASAPLSAVAMNPSSTETISFNYDPATYSEYAVLAPNYPGYPVNLKNLQMGMTFGEQIKQLNPITIKSPKTGGIIEGVSEIAPYESVDSYFTGQYKKVPRESREVLKYALKNKFNTYPYARYKLLKTGDAQVEYNPIYNNPKRTTLETFYKKNLGPLLMEMRSEYQQHLKNSRGARFAYKLQSLRFGSWDWLANRWYTFRGRK